MKTRLDGRRQDVAADLETRVERIHASPTRPPPGRIETTRARDVIRAGIKRRGNQPRRGPDGSQTRRKGARE